jgi:formylglycine-generating enzyme required for sulfatase activity
LVNQWGLAEMHGQIWEWCGDQWHLDPIGQGWPSDGQPWQGLDSTLEEPGISQMNKSLLRGGSWYLLPGFCRSAYRGFNHPVNQHAYVGFRVCCLPQDLILYS